jgi:hypothetical protein
MSSDEQSYHPLASFLDILEHLFNAKAVDHLLLPWKPYLSPTDLAMISLTGPSRRVNACSPRVATTSLSEVARTEAARA